MRQHISSSPGEPPSPARPVQPTRPPYFATLGKIALLFVVASVAYLPSINGGFIFDDDLLLTDNALIQAPDGLLRFWYSAQQPDYVPLTCSTLWFEWRLWGMNSTGYHVTNLLLHIAACLLIWVLLQKLSIPGGFLASLLFAIHPINVESVAWVEQRKNTLSILFLLLSINWYLKSDVQSPSPDLSSRRGVALWYFMSLLAFALAVFSKGSVAILPLLLLLIVWWQRGRIAMRDLLRTMPFFLLAAVLTPVILWFVTRGTGGTVRNATFVERMLGAGTIIWFYLSKALAPIGLLFVYPQWQIQTLNLLWWLPLAAAAIVTAALVRQLHRPQAIARSLLFAWGFFCVALLPVLGFTDPGYMKYSLVANHYQHIALISVVALLAASWSAWQQQAKGAMRSAAIAAAIATVSTLAVLTWNQNRLYGDPVMLYEATLEANPDCWMAHTNLGIALAASGRRQEAIQHYQRTLATADTAQAHFDLGNALMAIGQPQEAIPHYQRAVELRPDYANAHYSLARALLETGRSQEATEQYQQALKLKPDFAEARYELGILQNDSAQVSEAIELFVQNLKLNPTSADAHNNFAWVFATSPIEQFRDPNRAVELAKKAIELGPNRVDFFNTLGVAYYRAANWQNAIDWLNKSTSARDGGDVLDWFFLAMAHQRLGDHAEAYKWYHQAAEWLKTHAPHDEELLRLRREAEELLAGESAENSNIEKRK